MKRKIIQVTITLFLCFLFSCSLNSKDTQESTWETEDLFPDYSLKNEIIVKVDSHVSLTEIDTIVPGIRQKTFAKLNNARYVLYSLFDGYDKDVVLMALMTSGKVLFAEKNIEYSLCMVPNDPYYSYYQYAPRITHCEEAWDITRGDNSVIVAIIDTGINGTHEDLDNVIPGKNIITGEDIPASTNSDDIGHGTHVAGIIGAVGNNSLGIAGVAWNVQLMPVKIFAPGINTTTAEIAAGLIWAIDNGADVINMSIGSGLYSIAVKDAVNYAYAHDVVLVASMGNDFRNKMLYPAALPGIIAVGSSNGRDEVSPYSTRGNHISVVAPGESIYSLWSSSDDDYTFASGTSMAAPFVTGTAALLLSHNPGLKQEEVRSILEDSADPLGAEDFSTEYGYGRVNVYNALSVPPSNHYASITVNVTNKGEPMGGVKVLIQDNGDDKIIQSGFTSYGGSEGSVNGQIIFHYIKLGDYTVRVHIGESQDQNVILTVPGENPEVTFAFDTSMTLIVNAIKIMNNALLTSEFLYMQKLTAMGKYYSTWKIAYHGPPPKSLVNAYDMVIWFTGRTEDDPDNYIEVITGQEVEVIRNYLDSGGRLFLCGNNIAESLSVTDPSFLNDYLYAQYLDSPLSHDELNGRGLLDGMYSVVNMVDEDQIDINPGAVGILDSSDDVEENHWAGLSFEDSYRLVFTSVTPNDVVLSLPDTFFEDIINWLDLTN